MGEKAVRIVADTFERDSGVLEALTALDDVHVDVCQLDVADYDVGRGVLVERKTVPDLHLSLQRGRLWRQIGRLRDRARWPCLLIEGGSLADPTSRDGIRGACLSVLGQGVAIIRSEDVADSARWLRLLALRGASSSVPRDRPVYAQRLKSEQALVREAMLAAVPGISVVGARQLLARFGSVASLVAAGYDEWRTVAGIGPARAEALRRAVS